MKLVCRICANTADNRSFEAKEMMYGLRDKFTYFQCSVCGCVQIAEFPENISEYYKDYYAFTVKPSDNSLKGKIKNKLKQWRNHHIFKYSVFNQDLLGKFFFNSVPYDEIQGLRALSYVQSLSTDSRILEVGCGSGRWLKNLKSIGFNQLVGVDPFYVDNADADNSIRIIRGYLNEVKGVQFDLIMFHHSFEHVPDPLETLQTAKGLLRERGICLIRIPVSDSFAFGNYGVNWIEFDAPRHFFLHTVKSMTILAEKAALKISDIIYDTTEMEFWGSDQYAKDIPHFSKESYVQDRTRYTKKQIKEFKAKAALLNQQKKGGRAIFVLNQ